MLINEKIIDFFTVCLFLKDRYTAGIPKYKRVLVKKFVLKNKDTNAAKIGDKIRKRMSIFFEIRLCFFLRIEPL